MSTKVFSKIFVGVRTDQLGFMTPYEENAAFNKRKETVLKWLAAETYGTWVNGKYVPPEVKGTQHIHDNVPLEGFRITDDIKRVYWGGGNVVFRVMDPRGFELEIQSQNLMMLINNCVITNGKIEGKCIWGRDGSTNVLLHESSEEYANSIKAAETIVKPKPLSEDSLVVGHTYFCSDGIRKVTYLGKKKIARWPYVSEYSHWKGQRRECDGPSQVAEYHTWADVHDYKGYVPGITASKSSIAYKEAPHQEVCSHKLDEACFTSSLKLNAEQTQWWEEQKKNMLYSFGNGWYERNKIIS